LTVQRARDRLKQLTEDKKPTGYPGELIEELRQKAPYTIEYGYVMFRAANWIEALSSPSESADSVTYDQITGLLRMVERLESRFAQIVRLNYLTTEEN
jgi:hypothetical protein